MQLTNNAIQKTGEEYGKFEEGNIISTDTLFDFISKEPEGKSRSKKDLHDDFKKKSVEIIKDSIRSIKGKMVQQKYNFELLGYDFILDKHLNTVLIEVNTNPCLEESNQLLKNLLPRMLDDLFNVVMDPIFGPVEPKYKSAFKLPGELFMTDQKEASADPHPGYADDENLWDYVCSTD